MERYQIIDGVMVGKRRDSFSGVKIKRHDDLEAQKALRAQKTLDPDIINDTMFAC